MVHARANEKIAPRHDALRTEAEASGVFGVPSFVFDGEIFWGGDRIFLLRERLSVNEYALLRAGLIVMTRPDKPNDPDQAYRAAEAAA